ncbi:MAG: amidohydrolase [Actinomycetota bacterium]|nr:amidohydrolase [Actinomycetota bacterium]
MSSIELALTNVDCSPWNPDLKGIGITGGRVAAHWTDESAVDAQVIVDCGGRTLLPGIEDSHLHGYEYGRSLTAVDVSTESAFTLEELRAVISRARPEETGWVRGIGWDDTVMKGTGPGGTMTARDIDDACPDVPVILSDVTGHQALCNSVALARAGLVGSSVEDPEGGRIVRLGDGSPSGLLYEAAVASVNAAMPHVSIAAKQQAILAAQESLWSQGVVAYTDPGLGPGARTLMDGTGDLDAVQAYRNLVAAQELKLRVDVMLLFGGLGGTTAHDVAAGLDIFGSPEPMAPGGHLGISQVKVFADGIPRSRTAWMGDPYDDCTHGKLQVAGSTDDDRVAELHAILFEAASRGWQIGLHTIGDRAISTVVEGISRIKSHDSSLRHYVIHGDFVIDEDLIRMQELGITLNANPSIRWSVGGRVAPIVGEERNNQRQRLRTAWDAGVNVCSSSDAPVASPDWRVMVAAAMTRAWRDDPQRTDEQRLTAQEAIRSLSANAAWQSGAESWRGNLNVGQVADFVVLDERVDWLDPWSLPEIPIAGTAINGVWVFGGIY